MAVDERSEGRERAALGREPVAAPPATTNGVGQPGTGVSGRPAASPVGTARRRLPRRVLIPALVVVIIIAAIIGFNYWRNQTLYVSTDNAMVSGDMVQVGTVNTGQLSSVAVDVGSTVHQGDIVANLTLPSTLSVTDSGTPRLGFRGTQDVQAPVTSPIDGVVVQRLGNPGDTIAAGQTIITVVDPSRLWVQAQINENTVGRVKVGQAVDVHADSLGATVPGRVLAVNRASAASFSPLPQGNTSGNFTKVTQLVPVKIAVDYGRLPLVLGSSVEVQIHVQ